MPERTITTVMNVHAERLIAMDEGVMVAIGELEDGTPCIHIYAKSGLDALAEEIGAEIEGHPVVYIFSDEVRPLN